MEINTYLLLLQPVKKVAPISKDPNVVETQEEEEQILKAIELSLKDSSSPRTISTSSYNPPLYPSVNMSTGITNANAASSVSGAPKELKKVRALYDFEAAEDNELTFNAGEIICVTDDSDQNWWKGSNQRGEGLFPVNFVTADLDVEPEKILYEKAKKMVQFKETAEVKEVKEEPEEVEINEEKINRLLHLLHEADPTNPEKDTEEMINLEREANNMGPLIDAELERVDRKHAQLTQLSADLVEALGLYHTLMREPQFLPINKMNYGYQPVSTPMSYNGNDPQHMSMPMMGPPPGLVPSLDRPPFMVPTGLPPGMHYPHMPPVGSGHLPPQGQLPQMPLHVHQQMMEDRRIERMEHYSGPGMPNYGPPGMVQPNFPLSGPASQTTIQSSSHHGPNYITSNTQLPR
nr:signal transducing adapter molecule 1 [Leptinotarsa decemlineata]